MALDHRIQELLLDGPRSEAEIFKALGPVGSAQDWSPQHLRDRLGSLRLHGRVEQVEGGRWQLVRPAAKPAANPFASTLSA